MNHLRLKLATTCITMALLAPLHGEDATAKPAASEESPTVQQLDRAWHNAQQLEDKGAASHDDVLAARIKLAEARIHEEQQAILAACKERLVIAEKLQHAGDASSADVAKADVALREATVALLKD